MESIQVVFWGTRGSLPRPPSSASVRAKLVRALEEALAAGISSVEDTDGFISRLPFDVRDTYGGNTPCVEVRGGEDLIVLDAGTGLRDLSRHVTTRELAGPLRVHLLLSHLHWDHIQGFPYFAQAYDPGTEIHVHGFHQDIEEAFRRQQEPPFFPVALDQMAASISFHRLELGKTAHVAGFGVRGFRQNHPGDSFGYALEREGVKVVYSSDAEHLEDAYQDGYLFVDFIRDADLLIFDAAYTLADQMVDKRDWGHSSNMIGVELAVRAGVRRLCLFHHDHTLSDPELQKVRDGTIRYLELFADREAIQVEVAYDGLTITLGEEPLPSRPSRG